VGALSGFTPPLYLANQIWFARSGESASLPGRIPRFGLTLHATQIRRDPPMARPPARDLTERELEVMHVFWKHPDATAAEARDHLAAAGLDRAYTTVATLVRILYEKGFLEPMNTER